MDHARGSSMAVKLMAKYRQKLFTTGEIAAMVDTTPKTVARWIDEGLLKGTFLPGMTERRCFRDDIRAFFEKMGWDYAIRALDEWDDRDAEGPSPAPRPKGPPPPRGKPRKDG
jgi:hypothetical protein